MDSAPFRIVIVGGGIAGLATAVALRAPKRQIIILEKSQMLREVGALISLQPNASKIVSSWEIDQFLAASEPVTDRKFRILDAGGQLVQQIPLDTSRYGADRVVYHRQDLHTALKEAATSPLLSGPPAEIHTGAEVDFLDAEQGVVRVRGGEEYVADLIVGADGIRSAARSFVLGTEIPAQTTGLSAYRLLIPLEPLKAVATPPDIDLTESATTMIMGFDRRVVMGPGRGGKLFGVVALVPDEKLNEISPSQSWTEQGSLQKLLDTFADFPSWVHGIFQAANGISLWQLRDLPQLDKWVRGRTILIGDASHAMLPTQGQGASQSIEDAEALQTFFSDITSRPSTQEVADRLAKVFDARYERASLIQAYSRQQAEPATDGQSKVVTLNTTEFMDYNCKYHGARAWLGSHQKSAEVTA